MTLLFKYLWFVLAAFMLVNVMLWRRSLRKLVDAGTITEQELHAYIRGAVLWIVFPAVLLGAISLAAGWSDPFCAGAFSFDGPARAAASSVILTVWGALLWWMWIGNGAEVLGRIGPALSNRPRYDRRYPPRLVRLAVTGWVVVSGAGYAIGSRQMDIPRSPDGCLLMEQAR